MKICVIHNYYRTSAPSGENVAVESDVRLLRAHGHEVATLRWENDDLTESPFGQLALSVKCTWNYMAYRKVLQSLRRMEPDVVHVHNTFPQASPAVLYAARRFSRSAIVMTVHNYRMLCANGLLFRNGRTCTECVSSGSSLPAIRYGCYRRSRLKTLPVALSIDVHRRLGTYWQVPDAVIVLTAFQRDLLSGAVEPGRLFVKPPHYSDPPVRVPWSERCRSILYVGRLSAEKGVNVLIEALSQMPGAPTCDIVGDGEERRALEATTNRLGMAGRVRFHGLLPPDKAQQAISRAVLLVVPSVWAEGFPLVLREAMALGVPVLASRIGSLKEIVKDGWNGRLFDAGRPDALALALGEILADEDRLKQFGDNAFREFVSKYSESSVYESLLEIYAKARTRRSLDPDSPVESSYHSQPADVAYPRRP